MDSLLVLLALGRRSHKLRAEITKAVSTAPARASTTHARQLRMQLGREIKLICQLTAGLLEAPRQELDEMLSQSASRYFEEPTEVNRDEAVQDVALSLPLLSWNDGITDGRRLMQTFGLAAAVAELPAEH